MDREGIKDRIGDIGRVIEFKQLQDAEFGLQRTRDTHFTDRSEYSSDIIIATHCIWIRIQQGRDMTKSYDITLSTNRR